MRAAAHANSPLQRLRRWLVRETTGGILLLAGVVVALAWANSPWRASYTALSSVVVGPASLYLDLPLTVWVSDGLLAVFFFIVGIELKQEFVAGSLRNLRQAAVPVLAAVGGMATPALFFVAFVTVLGEPTALHGWAIPTATDIAFALTVLTFFGRGAPHALRTFLLTLAVVDDLLAITVIAVFYTNGINLHALAGAAACVAAFAALVRMRVIHVWALIPVAIVTWGFVHASGIHPTIAGVVLGFCVPVLKIHADTRSRAYRFDQRLRPLSSVVVLPLFAFVASGVSLVGGVDPLHIVSQPVTVAVFVGLVLGKSLGVMGTTAIVTRFTPLRLPDAIGLRELFPIGLLTGIGFTVSMLMAELSFPDGAHAAEAKIAILGGSLLSAVLGAVALRRSARLPRAQTSP